MKNKKISENKISYYEEWFGKIVSLMIKERRDIIKSDEIDCEKIKSYYDSGLSSEECFNELLAKRQSHTITH